MFWASPVEGLGEVPPSLLQLLMSLDILTGQVTTGPEFLPPPSHSCLLSAWGRSTTQVDAGHLLRKSHSLRGLLVRRVEGCVSLPEPEMTVPLASTHSWHWQVGWESWPLDT